MRFTDSDREPFPQRSAGLYDVAVNWGDGLQDGGSTRNLRGGGYEVLGSHFYCAPGIHRATVTITKSPAAEYHDGESITVKLAVRVKRR